MIINADCIAQIVVSNSPQRTPSGVYFERVYVHYKDTHHQDTLIDEFMIDADYVEVWVQAARRQFGLPSDDDLRKLADEYGPTE